MKEKSYRYIGSWASIYYLVVLILAFSVGFASGQEQTVPKLKYEKKIEVKGCGDQLNKEGLKLQDKGLELFFVKGRTTEAVDLLEKAIKLEPRLFPSYMQLGFYYLEVENNPEKAITLLKKAIEHCSKVPLLYQSLADCYARIEQHHEAIHNYNKAEELGIEPAPPFYYNRGNSYSEVKEYDKAIENYKKAVELDPKKFNAWRNLVIVYYQKGDKKNAIKCAKTLEKLDPKGDFGAWGREAIRMIK